MRVVGQVSVRTDQVGSIEDVIGAWGMMVPTEEAVAIGITALPDPVGSVNSDAWVAYQGFQGGFLISSAVGITGDAYSHWRFDSRAMRKVEQGFDVVTVIANSSATAGLVVIVNQRLLVKLH